MLPENKIFLEQHKHTWEFLKLAGELNMGHMDRQRLLELVREEWEPRYMCCLTCGADVCKMVEYAYTQFEKHPDSKHMTFPKQKKVK